MPQQEHLAPLADSATPSLSILSPAYRLTTIGIVSLVALIAFEALAVATAMPAVARALGGVAWYAMAFGITVASGHGQAVPGGARRNLWALGAATGIGLLYVGGQGQGVAAAGLLAGAAALALVCTWKLLPAGTLRAGRGLPSVMALRGLAFAAFFGAEAFLPLLLPRERGLSAPAAGLVLSAGALGWCSASWYQGHSRNGWSRHRFLRLGTSALLAGVVLTASAAWQAVPVGVAVAGWVVAGLGMGLLSASLSVLTLSMSAPGQQGANSSALQLSEAIAVAATLAIGGSLFSAWLEASAPLAYLAGFGVAASMAVLAASVVGRTGTRQVFMA